MKTVECQKVSLKDLAPVSDRTPTMSEIMEEQTSLGKASNEPEEPTNQPEEPQRPLKTESYLNI